MREITLKEIRENNKEKVIGEFFYQDREIKYKSLIDENEQNIENGLYIIIDFETKENLFIFYLTKLKLNRVVKTFCSGSEKNLQTYDKVHKEIKKIYINEKNKKLLLIKVEVENLNEELKISSNGIRWRKKAFTIKKEENGETKVIDREEKSYKYNRIVYGAPGTGKSHMLEKDGEIFKTNISIKKEENINGKRYWLVTCGEGNKYYDNFKEKGIFSIGWQEIKNVQTKTKEELNEEVKKIYGGRGIAGTFLYYMTKEMKQGDILIVRRGTSRKIVGYGEIVGNYTEQRIIDIENTDYYHNIEVKWNDIKEIELKSYRKNFPRNTISRADNELVKIFLEECLNKKGEYEEKEISTMERVTFYDGYTYGQFVGAYKPVPYSLDETNIVYKYVPGPFMLQLVKAYKNEDTDYLLIIEEINRAKADKVFGNIFQLLDRNEEGESKYKISISEEQKKYLEKELEDNEGILEKILEEGLYIPKNLYIWATMNNADQGVYPLDTAFKRRWSFEYIRLNQNEKELNENYKIQIKKGENGKILSWNLFRNNLNDFLLENGIYEDRLIAPFFIKDEEFNEEILEEEIFLNKLMMYIFDDVLKHKLSIRRKLFKENILSFSKLITSYEEGEEIFSNEFIKRLEK
jgi:hypothetical protein